MNLLTDSFSELFKMPKATTLEESQKRINVALNVLIKKRQLWYRMAQEHVDKTIHIAFTKKDGEFECKVSKVKAVEMIQSGGPSILDDDWPLDNDSGMDWTWTKA